MGSFTKYELSNNIQYFRMQNVKNNFQYNTILTIENEL